MAPPHSLPLALITEKRARDQRRDERNAREARRNKYLRVDDSGRVVGASHARVSLASSDWQRHIENLLHVIWANNHNNGVLIPHNYGQPQGLYDFSDQEMRDTYNLGGKDKEKERDDFIRKVLGRATSGLNETRRRETATAMTIALPYLAKAYATMNTPRVTCGCSGKSLRNVLGIDMKELVVLPVLKCHCPDWTVQLLDKGFFPTVPNAFTAISLDLLEQFNCIATNGSLSKFGFAKGMEEFLRIKLRREVYSTTEVFRNCIPWWLRVRIRRDEYVSNALNQFLDKAGPSPHSTAAPISYSAIGDSLEMNAGPNKSGNEASIKPYRFGAGRLPTLCPACFHRVPNDRGTKAILAIDGNFSHSRYAHVAPDTTERFDEVLFEHVPVADREKVESIKLNTKHDAAVCGNNFKATGHAKPRTMQLFDETGLLVVVCRHDMPLRFLNIFAGERLGWIQFTIERLIEILDTEVCEGIEVLLLYDIACQLEPFIKARDTEGSLSSRLSIAVNKFHGFAHQYRCHELWGAHQLEELGESDGEGTERIWAKLRVLVSSGRGSTKANRMLFLDNFTLALSFRKRMALATILRLRMEKYQEKLVALERQLDVILSKVVNSNPVSADASVSQLPIQITEELLRIEQKKQRTYFGAPSIRLDQPHVNVLKLVEKEKELCARVQAADTLKASYLSTGRSEHEADEARNQALSDIPYSAVLACTEELNTILADLGQTREEWAEGSPRYMLAMRKRAPERQIYLAVKKCETAQANLDRARKNTTTPPEGIAHLEYCVTREKDNAEALMRAHKHSPEDWKRDRGLDPNTNRPLGPGLQWARQHYLDAVTKVSIICQRLYKSAAMRSQEFYQLKAQVSGQKERDHVIRQMLSRYPAMEADIKEFNKEIKELPAKYRPAELTMNAFAELDSNESFGGPGGRSRAVNPRDALFYLELCKSELVGEVKGPSDLWAMSPDIRVGISVLLRRDRCREEVELLKLEWDRLVDYTRFTLVTMWEFVSFPTKSEQRFLSAVYDKLWGELIGAKTILLAASRSSVLSSVGDLEGVVVAIEERLEAFYRDGVALTSLSRRKPQFKLRLSSSSTEGEPIPEIDSSHPNHLFRPGLISLPRSSSSIRPVDPVGLSDIERLQLPVKTLADFDVNEDDGEAAVAADDTADFDGTTDTLDRGFQNATATFLETSSFLLEENVTPTVPPMSHDTAKELEEALTGLLTPSP